MSLDATTTSSVMQVSSGTEAYESSTTTSIAEAFPEITTLGAPTITSVVETASETTSTEITTTTPLEEATSQSATLETTTTTSVIESSSETAISQATTTTTIFATTATTSMVGVSSEKTTFEATTTASVTEDSPETTIWETTATSDAYTSSSAAIEAQTTTEITTTTTSEAETTTTAVAIPSFKLVASGGAVNGLVLQGLESAGSTVMFNPTHPTRVYRPRKYIIDPNTGRIKDQDTGIYLCAGYYWSKKVEPAVVALCYGTPGPDQVNDYLTCGTVDGKLSCTVPQAVCGMNQLETEVICKSSSSEVYDRLLYEVSNNKNLAIGKGNPGNSYAAVELTVQEA